jgi:hypothetical protein
MIIYFENPLTQKQSKPYVDGNLGPNLREARTVTGWVNIVNGIQTLFS